MASTKICLDLGNMLWNCPYCRAFCLSNIDNPLYPTFKNTTDLLKQTTQFLAEEKLRQSIIKKARKYIRQNNRNYFHHASQIYELLHSQDLSQQCLESLQKYND
jgi:hypothetical protein